MSPAPEVPPRSPDLALAPSPVVNPMPRLAVVPAPPLGSTDGAVRVNTAGIADLARGNPVGGDAGGLLIVGIDTGAATGSLTLPPGNRLGAFSISPWGGQPGSPGGVPGGIPEGGTGGPGTGGDGSTGVGPGNSGGGGSANGGVVMISGGTGSGSGLGEADSDSAAMSASLPLSLVYPVKSPPRPRLGALTVTSGPTGGGGLRVYGVLQGGKIYTIYLPMPGKNWVLQYVHNTNSPDRQGPRAYDAVARLDHGLVPPSAKNQFDFRRPRVPEDKADEFIILHGVIREDGSVDKLRVLQGIVPGADQAALAAFRKWKFQPALHAGKPVAVEILVGVPARAPERGEERGHRP